MIVEKDQQVLTALAAAREQHEEIAALLDFYYNLYSVQFEAKGAIAEPRVRDKVAMEWRQAGGIPQLAFDQLGLDPKFFAQLVASVTDVLLKHNPGWDIDRDDWAPDELVALAQRIFETWDTLTAPGAGSMEGEDTESRPGYLNTLAVGFSLAPYLQRAAGTILPHLDLAKWNQGYCPICGGRPNLALLEETGVRRLLCSRCATLWPYKRIGCPFCAKGERPVYYPSDDGAYRLCLCLVCHHYLKTVDLRKAQQPVHPMVERLVTVGMDLAAREEGYKS